MTTDDLKQRRDELRATITSDMSMLAFRAVQARVDLISLAISRIDDAKRATERADEAIAEVMKWA